MARQVIVIAGVAGCGKTTVGEMLAQSLGWDFADADDYHSDEHKVRMKDGTGLTDEDRIPWLGRLTSLISAAIVAERPMVLACSGLSRAHRDALRVGPGVELFLIDVPEEEIIRRLQGRTGHFDHLPSLERRPAPIPGPFLPRMVTYRLRAGFSSPGCTRPDLDRSSRHRLSLVWGRHGPEHPDSGFRVPSGQHNRRPCNRSTNRRKTPCHGFHDKSRYTIRRDCPARSGTAPGSSPRRTC